MSILNKTKLLIYLIAASTLFSATALYASVSPDTEAAVAPAYRPGEVLVEFAPGTGEPRKNAIKAVLGETRLIRKIRSRVNQGPDIERIEIPAHLSPPAAAAKLRAAKHVKTASPDYRRKASYAPNDPSFLLQYGLHNTGQSIKGTAGTADADIDAPEAWEREKGLSTTITVAVVDTGLDSSHTEFAGKTWVNTSETPGNDLDDDGNGYVDDVNGYNWSGISSNQVDSGWYFGRSTSPKYFAQSIKGTGRKLTHVGIYMDKTRNPSAAITVSVRTALTGADLGSYTISPGEISGATFIYKALSAPLTAASGTTYYIVAGTVNSDTSNYYAIYGSSSEGGIKYEDYAGGNMHYSGDGTSWTDAAQDELFFVTNPNGYPLDDNAHGTHVSGITAARTDNATGTAGVSFGAKIMALKVLDAPGYGYDSDIAEALIYAADNGADVANMSLGGGAANPVLQTAVNYAAAQGLTMLAAAGNDGNSSINYPAGYDNIIGVAATDNKDVRANFSNFNVSVDVAAPGVNVYSTMPTYPVSLTGFGNNLPQNYAYLSGTSMATPMATGVAALIKARNPGFSPGKVQGELESTADDKGAAGRDDQYGWGRVNAHSAVSNVSISLTSDGVIDFGVMGLDESSATPDALKEVVSVDTGPANLFIKSSPFSNGGDNWMLASANGNNQVVWDFSGDGLNWATFFDADTAYGLANGLGSSGLQNIFFRLRMPTGVTQPNAHAAQVTVLAVAP